MSEIIDFYTNKPTKSKYTLDEILSQRDDWFENCHNHIQWLFPIHTLSHFNENSPILTKEIAEDFLKNDEAVANFDKAILRMLSFLGIDWDSKNGVLSLSDNYDFQKYTWTEFNHNSLRITRMLTCMSILGRQNFAVKLYTFMFSSLLGKKHNVAKSLDYWADALNGLNKRLE